MTWPAGPVAAADALATGGRSSTPRLSACNDTSWPSGSSGDAFLEPPTASARPFSRGIQRRRISVGSWPLAVNTRRKKMVAQPIYLFYPKS